MPADRPHHRRLPILMWHHVGEAPTAAMRPYAVAQSVLEAQLDALVGAGYQALTFDDLREGLRVERPVVLSFDDGYTSFADHASPAMLARGMRAVLFVVAGRLGGVNDWDKGARALTLLDADGLSKAAADGHELGVHAWVHRSLPEVPTEQLERELFAARAVLETLGSRTVRSISYPYGLADDRVVGIVQRCGFDIACLDSRGPGSTWPAGLGLRRVDVGPDTTPERLLEDMGGTVVDVDPAGGPGVDAFQRLVHLTLGAAGGEPPPAGWGAVHAAAAPLAEVLRLRGVPPQQRVFEAATSTDVPEGRPLGSALVPLADELDSRLDTGPPLPVWDVATPAEATGLDAARIRLGPHLSDPARLLWQLEPAGHVPALAEYLRGAGWPRGRRAVQREMEHLVVSEAALLTREALEKGPDGDWGAAETAFRRVPAGTTRSPLPRRDGDPPRRFLVALGALVRQNLREHYGGSILGLGWSIVCPLLTFAVLAVFFGQVVRIEVPRYPEFLLAGLLPWVFLQRAVGEAAGAVRGRGSLLRLSAFPRAVLPLATVSTALVDFVAQLAIVVPVFALGAGPTLARLLAVVPAIVLATTLASAGALLVAGLSVRYRDTAHLVPLLLSLTFYAVPVIYPPAMVPAEWRTVYRLNPAAVLVEAFRSVLYGGEWPPAWALATTAATAALGAVAAWRWYAASSDRFVAEA